MKRGKVYIVGAGPGRPDLLTLQGLNILKQADVIIYDYLIDKKILEWAKPEAELISARELGKGLEDSSLSQQRINQLLVEKARQGKNVLRLKNGCPSLFSRLSQELEVLVENGIEFGILPGVTAGSAASCLSGIPLTEREIASSCVFLTGQEAEKEGSLLDWQALSRAGTLIIYMGVGQLESIIEKLLSSGKKNDTPVAVVKDVSLVTQKLVLGKLEDISEKTREAGIEPPAVIIVGEVVRLAERFNWWEKKKILFTGLSRERPFLEGNYLHLPLIKIVPMEDYQEFDQQLKKIAEFDWIVFTSRYGVKYFFERLLKIGMDARALSKSRIAAIGSSTSRRLLKFGIVADLVPEKESSQGLIEQFRKLDLKGKKVFLPRADISDKGLAEALQGMGAEVKSCFAYRNLYSEDLPELDLASFQEIFFTSPSTVRSFLKRYGELPKGVGIKCIGEVTLQEARKWKLLD